MIIQNDALMLTIFAVAMAVTLPIAAWVFKHHYSKSYSTPWLDTITVIVAAITVGMVVMLVIGTYGTVLLPAIPVLLLYWYMRR